MKKLIKKIKSLNIYFTINNVFRHNCWINKKIISASYLKDGDSGVIFLIDKEYCCKKCNKKWSD